MYSALRALDLAVTVDFSIVKAISPNEPSPDSPTPSLSAALVASPEPKVDTVSDSSAIVASVSASVTPLNPVGSAWCVPVPEKSVSASLYKASLPLCELYFDFIAKIKPVGPLIGWTPATSYAIRFGIALRTREINTGSNVPMLFGAEPEPILLAAAASEIKFPAA